MDWERLTSDYFDDLLSPEETAALFDWIRSHPDNARQFARAAFLHRCLGHRLSAMRQLAEGMGAPASGSDAASMENANGVPAVATGWNRFSWSRRRWWGVAAAIVLVAGILTIIAWPHPSPARLVAVEDAAWGGGIPAPNIGDRLPRGQITLNAGLITLEFDNGARIIVKGPASFAINDAQNLTLNRGALTAVAGKLGLDFTIATPTARVSNQGAEFGVWASANSTRVAVFNGKVTVANSAAKSGPLEISGGNAVDVLATGTLTAPFNGTEFARVMPADRRQLDLIDLMAGGDGTGDASAIGIDAATGQSRVAGAVSIRKGDHRYVPMKDNRALDGCFIPGGTMTVDSAGHQFTFPNTTLVSYGLIWAGNNPPWEGELRIATTFPGEAAGPSASRVLVMHSNNGFTVNLDAVRELHPQARITGFRARVGNSYRPATPGALPANPLASVHVLVDGVARFEKRGFGSVDDPFDITCPLSADDHFLTLATTDGGDGNPCDWVLWTRPELLVAEAGR